MERSYMKTYILPCAKLISLDGQELLLTTSQLENNKTNNEVGIGGGPTDEIVETQGVSASSLWDRWAD